MADMANRLAPLTTSELHVTRPARNGAMAEMDNNSGMNEATGKSICHKKGKLSFSAKHVLRKLQPVEFTKDDRDIRVNNQSSFKAQLHKCEKRFNEGASELVIHGLGSAIHTAVCLALRLKEIHHETLDLDVRTSTVTLVDKLEALSDDVDDEINKRQNSAIRIRVVRKVPVAVLKSK